MASACISDRLSARSERRGECLIWLGAKTRKGYGAMNVNRVVRLTHRLAWSVAHGAIPPGMCVCHRCDNPSCIEVSHLFLGTPADNTADMVAKGRGRAPGATNPARGVRHGRAKLSAADVFAIRASTESQSTLGRRFGIDQSSVCHIRRGRVWRHLINETNEEVSFGVSMV